MAKYLMSEKTANFIRQQMIENQLNANGADGETRRTRNSFFVPDVFAHPFEVKWGSSIDNGTNEDGSAKEAGSWIIWLPSDDLLMINGVSVDVKGTLTAAGEPYPDGWYKLDEEVLSKTAGGSLWLVITYSDSAATTAKFANAREFTDGESFSVLIADAKVDETTSVRSVKQTIDSGIVLAGGKGNCACTKQYPDGMSLSNAQKGNESEGESKSNFWSIKGFGKFTEGGNEMGTYEEATEMELGSTSADSCAFICRVGSGESGNAIAYRKLKLDDSIVSPSAFQYVEETNSDGDLTTRKITNCTFVNGNQIVTLADYVPPDDGTVYLNIKGTMDACSVTGTGESLGVNYWNFTASMANTKLDVKFDPGKEMQYSIPLYDFVGGKVTCDYRTAFLHVNSNLFDYGVRDQYACLFGLDYKSSVGDGAVNGFAFVKNYLSHFIMGRLCGVNTTSTGWNLIAVNSDVGVRAIKDADGNVLAYFPATADVTISSSGGGIYTAGNEGVVIDSSASMISTNSSYSDSVDLIYKVTYDSEGHQLLAYKKKLVIKCGVITNIEEVGTEVITTAVEES